MLRPRVTLHVVSALVRQNYAVVWPLDAPLAARNQRVDPLHETLQQRGCVFEEVLGWERPAWFSTSPAPVRCDRHRAHSGCAGAWYES